MIDKLLQEWTEWVMSGKSSIILFCFRFYSSLQFALENRDHISSLPVKESEQSSTGQDNSVDSLRSRRKSKGMREDSQCTSARKNKGLESDDDTESHLNFFH